MVILTLAGLMTSGPMRRLRSEERRVGEEGRSRGRLLVSVNNLTGVMAIVCPEGPVSSTSAAVKVDGLTAWSKVTRMFARLLADGPLAVALVATGCDTTVAAVSWNVLV